MLMAGGLYVLLDVRRQANASTESEAPSRGTRRPLTIVGWTLALMVVGPLVIAIFMSVVDDGLRGNENAAEIVVSLVVSATLGVTGWFVRAASVARKPERNTES